MKIVATVKLVPDPNGEKRIDPGTKRLVRTGVETVLNPYDEYAVEAALQLKEKLGGDTTVTVFSMAPESNKEVLRKPPPMGAEDAWPVPDAPGGSDVFRDRRRHGRGSRRSASTVICGGLSDDGSIGGAFWRSRSTSAFRA